MKYNSNETAPILQVENLKKYFPIYGGIFLRKQAFVHAVDDVSFNVKKGETLGLVGESGCGKTTLGRCIMGLYPVSGGSIKLHGREISNNKNQAEKGIFNKKEPNKKELDNTIETNSSKELDKTELKNLRLKMQMIFQDPFESLNSRHTVGEILEEKYIINNKLHRNINKSIDTDLNTNNYNSKNIGLSRNIDQDKVGKNEIKYNSRERKKEVLKLLELVGLPKESITKFPHEFSGGQRQRIGIARAISLEPEVLICDEPVSALDVSVQSQILNLILTLQKDMGLTTLFISHDLSVIRHVSDSIAVMYLGQIAESGDAQTVYSKPLHPYTKALISAVPIPNPEHKKDRIILKGEVPSPISPPKGCRFHTRCTHVMDICRKEVPLLKTFPLDSNHSAHSAACHLY